MPQLHRFQHALVDDAAGRERADVEILPPGHVAAGDFVFHVLAQEVQLDLQVVLTFPAGDEYLADVRFGSAGRLAEDVGIHRHFPHVHQGQAQLLALVLPQAEYLLLLLAVFGQKDQAGTVAAFFRNGNALQQYEFVRDLEQDPGSVAGLVVSSFGAAVAHVFQHGKSGFDDVVALLPVNVYQHADPACIAFIGRIVKSLRRLFLFHVFKIFYNHTLFQMDVSLLREAKTPERENACRKCGRHFLQMNTNHNSRPGVRNGLPGGIIVAHNIHCGGFHFLRC